MLSNRSTTITPVSQLEKNILELQKENNALKEQNEALQELHDELKQSYKELEQFSYAASHDLRSPLRTISNFAKLLHKRYAGKFDEEADEFLNFIIVGVKNMDRVTSDLLNYSRVGLGKQEVEETNLNDVIAMVKLNLREEIHSNEVTLNIPELPVILANRSALIQLFQNLIGNAIKFRKEELSPVIDVRIKDGGDSYFFEIEDNGVGMDEQFQNKAFQPFQRLNNNDRPGTGMGLAICKKVVSMHGGHIMFQSQSQNGTCFKFNLQKSTIC